MVFLTDAFVDAPVVALTNLGFCSFCSLSIILCQADARVFKVGVTVWLAVADGAIVCAIGVEVEVDVDDAVEDVAEAVATTVEASGVLFPLLDSP